MTPGPAPLAAVDQAERIRSLRAELRARARRRHFFPGVDLGDPSWDMLLELEVCALEQRLVSTSSLCIASDAPATTALRHIATLEGAGWITRTPDPADRRRQFIGLTARAHRALADWREASGSVSAPRAADAGDHRTLTPAEERAATARWLATQLAQLLDEGVRP